VPWTDILLIRLPLAIWVGGTVLAITIQAMRCSMTTHTAGDLPKDPSVLRTVMCGA